MTNGLNAPQRARYTDHSLAAYLAPLVEGRRVAVVGPTSGDVAKRFRALGASTVVAFGGSGEGVAVRPLTPGAIEAFHGKLDCIVVPDASTVHLDAVLDEARRALGQDGIVAVAARAGGGPALEGGSAPTPVSVDFYELRDALSARFASVQMLGRGPFVGYTFAALDGSSDAVTLDTRLIPDDATAPEAYVAVAGDREFQLDAISLVQVPFAEVLAALPVQVDTSAVSRAVALEVELKSREGKLKELEQAAAERWVKIQRLEHQLKELDDEGRKARDRAVKLTKDLEDERKLRQRIEIDAQMVKRVPDLPRVDPDELRQSKERAAELEREVTAAKAELTAARGRFADLERELDETQATEAELRQQLDEAERTTRDATKRLPTAAAQMQPAPERATEPVRDDAELRKLRDELGAAREQIQKTRLQQEQARAQHEQQTRTQLDAARVQNEQTRSQLEQARAQLEQTRAQLAQNAALLEKANAQLGQTREPESESGDYERIERELNARAQELIGLRAQLAERDAAVRELAYSLDAAERSDAAQQAQLAREQIAELSALNVGLASEAAGIVQQNELLRERVAHMESELLARSSEAQDARFRVAELEISLKVAQSALERAQAAAASAAPAVDAAGLAQLRQDYEAALAREAAGAEALETAQRRSRDADAALTEARRALDELHARAAQGQAAAAQRAAEGQRSEELQRHLEDSRNEFQRQFALIASMEDRAEQTRLELEGARAGYSRRVAELEREVEQLVQALEVVGTHSNEDGEQVQSLLREIDVLKASRNGTSMRLDDAEAALSSTAGERDRPHPESEAPTVMIARDKMALEPTAEFRLPPPDMDMGPGGDFGLASGENIRSEQLLSDLAETAARLAETEEALAQAREAALVADTRADETTRALNAARAEFESARQAPAAAPARVAAGEDVDTLRRETAERELLVRSLVAQLEDRDLRLRAMERRLVEDVERARRTESEIWEVELRARDQRIAALGRDAERGRSSESGLSAGNGTGPEVGDLRETLQGREREIQGLRTALDQVRAGLSSILVDGRGAVVAHDLVTILRQIEEPPAE